MHDCPLTQSFPKAGSRPTHKGIAGDFAWVAKSSTIIQCAIYIYTLAEQLANHLHTARGHPNLPPPIFWWCG